MTVIPRFIGSLRIGFLVVNVVLQWTPMVSGQEVESVTDRPISGVFAVDESFTQHVQPLLEKHCLRCHNADTMKSGIRVDQLDDSLQDQHLFLWRDIRKQIDELAMPPQGEEQPTQAERDFLSAWIEQAMNVAKSRDTQKNGAVRRLTVAQYRNTLRDLLGLQENLSDILPPDGMSKEGFSNSGQVLGLSPLQMEYYFDIAQESLDLCIVDETSRPVIQNFRMDFGAGLNADPCKDQLVLGANNLLLSSHDFVVTELSPAKPFEFTPFAMRTKYDFIEGYVGNDTIREWRTFDTIDHSVFACMRGTEGYPSGEPYQAVSGGLLLRPAIPSPEIFGESTTYGPMANFKISLRELPDYGDFRITVGASRYEDGMLLGSEMVMPDAVESGSVRILNFDETKTATTTIEQPGIYQVDVSYVTSEASALLRLKIGERDFSSQLKNTQPAPDPKSESPSVAQHAAVIVVRFAGGPLTITTGTNAATSIRRLVLTQLTADSQLAKKFLAFEQRAPLVGVHLGLRRDCGSTLNLVNEPIAVKASTSTDFVFSGAINDFPHPAVEKDNVNYLAGIREIGIRSEYTDGRPMPRLKIHAVEFEGPYYPTWPPATHRGIFIASSNRDNSSTYAGEIIRAFMTRAWRRPVTDVEASSIFGVWEESFAVDGNFQQSIKDALLVVLTSPQFLFMIENSAGPEAEDLDPWELASKLSYFLWNTAPDQELLVAAAENTMHATLDAQTDRLLKDSRFDQFLAEFATQWLSLEKFDVVEIDRVKYPLLTRDTRTQLRQEPFRFLRYLFAHNLPLANVIQSDFILANDTVAEYYDLADKSESGLEFVALKHESPNLGGILSQAGILAGLSDGREANPIKRGAWLARKIMAEPPDDPPPNVPQLVEDGTERTLREKLDRHRNQDGCVKCHTGIDPWGIAFQEYDAAGRFKKEPTDSHAKLPDGTEVADVKALKTYLVNDRIDQVAFSMLKHLSCYAAGRSLTYNELEWLREAGKQLKPEGYRMQDMLRFVVQSDMFLKK